MNESARNKEYYFLHASSIDTAPPLLPHKALLSGILVTSLSATIFGGRTLPHFGVMVLRHPLKNAFHILQHGFGFIWQHALQG